MATSIEEVGRLVRLWTGSIGRFAMIGRLVQVVFPLVNEELARWNAFAAARGSEELSAQALASIRDKKFHCQGGSAFSLYPGVTTSDYVRFVVAFQTISDYLDNLTDRAGFADEEAFRQLHLAITDALDPEGPMHDYYAYYPHRNDGGYLNTLVDVCRREICVLPSYLVVKKDALRLATLYSELQTYKHLDPALRESKLAEWASSYLPAYPDITLWEFSAACGSTLGLFMLCAAAASPNLRQEAVQELLSVYFPWVCGLHILLDYFIDLDEDREHNDLNFVAYYRDVQEIESRLTYFCRQSLANVASLEEAQFTETIIYGLLAMYLSDPKVAGGCTEKIRGVLLSAAGPETQLLYKLCCLLRRRGAL